MKKIVSLFLCIAMLLTLSATAFAWNNPEGASIPMKATENVNLRNGLCSSSKNVSKRASKM